MPDASTPQFNTAEYAGQPGTDHCDYCQQTITSRYYRVNNRMACPACTEKAALAVPQESHAAFMRALLFGAGAAIAGLILVAAFEIATGIMIGYISLAVGWMVGKAMMAGSKGLGGRRYQIAAILLTYAAVSIAEIPVELYDSRGHSQANQQTQAEQQPDSGSTQSGTQRTLSLAGLGIVLGKLALLGLASPFLLFFQAMSPFALIGIVILFVGMRIAWRMTAATPASGIIGPFSSSPPAST
jgi:hypothetical protein